VKLKASSLTLRNAVHVHSVVRLLRRILAGQGTALIPLGGTKQVAARIHLGSAARGVIDAAIQGLLGFQPSTDLGTRARPWAFLERVLVRASWRLLCPGDIPRKSKRLLGSLSHLSS